jgi:glycosyltransferase involved in cell wall biosynthesis
VITAKVAVVVTTRNSERTLEACLQSIREQTVKDLELVVVDNFSSDRTAQIAGANADNVEIAGPERSHQRNRGAEMTYAPVIAFIDADMRLEPAVLEEAVGLLEDSGVPAVVIPETSVGEGFWASCRVLERSFYEGDELIEAARVYRRVDFVRSGGFDVDLTGAEDWDLSQRVAAGRGIAHTVARIVHDEGRVSLVRTLAKKRYYGRSFRAYRRKHPHLVFRQANLVARGAYIRNWRSLVRHPVLAAGMFGMKSLELGASGIGAISGYLPGARRGEFVD